ncbi:MAG: lysylphosphatidylglycerol synthase transmembrane domain-containing protein [Candidatus Cloacimonadota bacterium]|nr:lysylphosphatidylglycerol synthase transmembrane domain-containing protein [Candidatus Cloacimonadota bacterium]
MKKNKLHLLLGLLFGIVLIFLWIYFIDFNKVVSYLKKVQVGWVAVGAFLYLLAYFFRALRWKILLSTEINVSPIKVFLIRMGGNFLNYLIPIRAGELAKSYFLKKTDNIAMSRTLPSVFVDKMFDSIGIFLVLILIPFLHVTISKPLLILIILLILVVITGGVILVFAAIAKDKIVSIIRKFFFFVPKKYKEKFFHLIDLFVEGVGLFRHHLKLLPPVIGLTFLAVLTESLYFLCMFLAFQQPIDYFVVLFGYTLIYLSYILPYPPAQIGSNELIMVIIFSVGLGLNKEMVSAVMVFAHLLTGILITIIGLLALSYTGVKIFDRFSSSKENSIPSEKL